jgi:hypothetical protein
VQLERPRVTERREWHVGQSDLGVITMSFTGNSKQAGKVNADLMKFINETPALKEAMDQGMFTVKREGGKVSFEIPPESGGAHFLETVAAHFTNQAVMQHKHG